MRGFYLAIEEAARNNAKFRQVLYTTKHSQFGPETHPENDQFFRFETGAGKVTIDGNEYQVKDGDAVIVPAGSSHNVQNLSPAKELKLYTLYSPPHHKDGVIHPSKAGALSDSEEFDGATTE